MNAASLGGRIDAIVFDCGDTLLRLDPPRETIVCDAARELGLALAPERVRRAYESVDLAIACGRLPDRVGAGASAQRRGANELLCLALGIESALEPLHPLLLERFAERRHWTAFADAAEALARLGRWVPLHVLANWDEALIERLAESGLGGCFATVVASVELGVEKPAHACFEAFAARAGLRAEEALYVGNDYVADVVGARRAGFRPVLVDRDDRHPSADCVRVVSLAALADLVEPLLGRERS